MSEVLVLTTDDRLKAAVQEGLLFPRGDLFSSPEEALAALEGRFYPLIICESPLTGGDTATFLEDARGRNNHDAVLLLAADPSGDREESLLNQGSVQGLLKPPFSPWQIRSAVHEILSKLPLNREFLNVPVEGQKEKRIQIVGFPGDLSGSFGEIKSAALAGRGLFIQGEPGSGRKTGARLYLKHNPVGQPHLVPLSFSALTAEVRNTPPPSSTGLSRILKDFPGGGILYLEDLEKSPPELEGVLLPFLEKKVIVDNREGRPHPAVNLVASSRRSLDELEAEGLVSRRFREAWKPKAVRIPSLRERKRDFGRLVSYFIEKTALELGRIPPGLHPNSMKKLSQYRWPGNLAEMEGVIKWAVVLTDPDSDQIPENNFDFLFLGSPLPGGPEYQKAIQILARRILQGEGSIREIESHMMETLVILSGGSIARAVERSGIPKDRFYRYFKKKGSLNP